MKKILTCLVLLAALIMSPALFAQEITFTAQTITGTEVVTPALTWSTNPAADDCIATGDWVGAKGPSGSQTLPDITSSASYGLVCSWADDSITLSWTAPTENTDGTPLVDLEGFFIYYGPSSGNYPESVRVVAKAATSWQLEPLDPGDYYIAMTAYNSANIESVFSTEVHKLVGDTTTSESITISVNPRPNSPTGLTAT